MKTSKSVTESWRRSLLKRWLISPPDQSGVYVALFFDKSETEKTYSWDKNSPLTYYLLGYSSLVGSGINNKIDLVRMYCGDLNLFNNLCELKEQKLIDKLNRQLAKKMLRTLHMSDREMLQVRSNLDLKILQPEEEPEW